jgi:hypothetical protein
LAIAEYAQQIYAEQVKEAEEHKQFDEWKKELLHIQTEIDTCPRIIFDKVRFGRLQNRIGLLQRRMQNLQQSREDPEYSRKFVTLLREKAAIQMTLAHLQSGTSHSRRPKIIEHDSERGKLEQEKLELWNQYQQLLDNQDNIIVQQGLEVIRLRLHIRQLKKAPAMARAAYKAKVSSIRDELIRQQGWFNTYIKEAMRRKEALIAERNLQIELLVKSRRTKSIIKLGKGLGQMAKQLITHRLL